MSIGQPNSVGDLDKAIIRRYIKRNQQKLLYCYEKQLLAKPAIAGTAVAQFFITPDGKVDPSTATGVDPDVATCVAGVIRDIEFPKPKSGGVQVSYPFTFRPTDGASDAPPANEPVPVPAQEPATEPPPPPEPPAAPAPVESPFAAKRAELADCLRRLDHPYGAIVVDLTYDPRGAVSTANAHGLDNDDARACIARVARTIVKPNAPAIERCAIAFGASPADRLPGIEVGSDAIKADRRAIARLGDADAELAAAAERLVAAFGALVADVEHPPPIAIRGPLVLRAIDVAPMKLVNRALVAARAASVGVEPAVLRDGEWRLLHASRAIPEVPLALPAEPDGAFASLTSTDDVSGGFVEVLVTTKAILVPTSDAVIEVDANAFAAKVAALAHGTWMPNTIVVIAARDDVKFGDLARAIDVIEHAGLRWRIAPPKGS
jgi:hypothetical protein